MNCAESALWHVHRLYWVQSVIQMERFRSFHLKINLLSIPYWWREFSSQPLMGFWRHIIIEWLPGVRLRHFSTTCAVYRGLWVLVVFRLSQLSGRALATQARCPGFDSQRLPVFSLSSIFASKTSNLSLTKQLTQCRSRKRFVYHFTVHMPALSLTDNRVGKSRDCVYFVCR